MRALFALMFPKVAQRREQRLRAIEERYRLGQLADWEYHLQVGYLLVNHWPFPSRRTQDLLLQGLAGANAAGQPIPPRCLRALQHCDYRSPRFRAQLQAAYDVELASPPRETQPETLHTLCRLIATGHEAIGETDATRIWLKRAMPPFAEFLQVPMQRTHEEVGQFGALIGFRRMLVRAALWTEVREVDAMAAQLTFDHLHLPGGEVIIRQQRILAKEQARSARRLLSF